MKITQTLESIAGDIENATPAELDEAYSWCRELADDPATKPYQRIIYRKMGTLLCALGARVGGAR